MGNSNIRINDLNAQHAVLREEIDLAIKHIIDSSCFIRGHQVNDFEVEFGRFISASNVISCANGTDALYIGLKALGLLPGDEVIVPAHTWISTAEAVSQIGAVPVFCDIDPWTYTINASAISALITKKTKGIIPVHLYGHPADMPGIMKIAKDNNLWVIEDCAQAHGAEINGRPVGSFGDLATYSFYPGKNLGALGDAGAISTNRDDLALFMRQFANHGSIEKGNHIMAGINSRMDTIHASVLLLKLKWLKTWNDKRTEIAGFYDRELRGLDWLRTPSVKDGYGHVWHMYCIRSVHRDLIKSSLEANGIESLINYRISLPFSRAYANKGHLLLVDEFPQAYKHSCELLCLPIHPYMLEEDAYKVCDTIQNIAL